MRVPSVLRNQLGDDATAGLIEMLDAERRDLRADVLNLAAERFERRLTEEISKLRIDLGLLATREEISKLRVDLGLLATREEVSKLRLDFGLLATREEVSKLRGDLATLATRKELQDGLAGIRQEMGELRVDVLKGSFVFWVGQLAAIAALLAFMLRAV